MNQKIKEYEEFFFAEHSESFELLSGEGSVIISAPHAVEQLRERKPKPAEPETGVLARLLHDELNCPVIYKASNKNDDANYDASCDYKDAIEAYIKAHDIKVVLDLHQLSPLREMMINFGTAGFTNITDKRIYNILFDEFSRQELGEILLDIPFDASLPNTISSFTHRTCGVQAIQIEINTRLLYGEFSEIYLPKVYSALKRSILRIQEDLKHEGK